MALAPLGLSQSMDSVNTASNEEEVSATNSCNIRYTIIYEQSIVQMEGIVGGNRGIYWECKVENFYKGVKNYELFDILN